MKARTYAVAVKGPSKNLAKASERDASVHLGGVSLYVTEDDTGRQTEIEILSGRAALAAELVDSLDRWKVEEILGKRRQLALVESLEQLAKAGVI